MIFVNPYSFGETSRNANQLAYAQPAALEEILTRATIARWDVLSDCTNRRSDLYRIRLDSLALILIGENRCGAILGGQDRFRSTSQQID